MFKRVLIANRGEIAVRVMRTCREMGISPIAVFSEPDAKALHVRLADQAVPIGSAPARESYLVIDKILAAAKETGAEAIHPGYGFLSENAEFAEACSAAGIVFIGPPAAAIRAMGDKMVARHHMQAAKVPVVPGIHGGERGFANGEQALVAASKIGLPVMLKASAGGGGKGMRLVREESNFVAAFDAARREAMSAFGDDAVYLEKLVENPRHVEVQVMADNHGNALHFFERDCSIQRRHQKVIEETPCPVLDDTTRRKMGEVAVRAAKAVNYIGAGTVEYLYDVKTKQFFFLEMNTRLQVEHPITELCCGVDLVRLQLEVAAGQALSLRQEAIAPRGAAIECRIYAEDPIRFLPSPGTISALRVPSGPGVRDDSGVYAGNEISSHYDPMISKLSVWAPTRKHAVQRMRRALGEYVVGGIQTNLSFHRRVLTHPGFCDGEYDTGFIDSQAQALSPTTKEDLLAVAVAGIDAQRPRSSTQNPVDGESSCSGSAWRDAAHWRR
ncbi:MAG: acetyl-CoA carboxylase biotin carboxylase subunit [Deltaproteobacteria bacterium]|nr:acetyl-CoA carboxylase biotin carboxylase subunit [Deltaproteobacteria bacterium]